MDLADKVLEAGKGFRIADKVLEEASKGGHRAAWLDAEFALAKARLALAEALDAWEDEGFPGGRVRKAVPDSPYAMVRVGSMHALFLMNVGWTCTDRQGGWSHMEPPK